MKAIISLMAAVFIFSSCATTTHLAEYDDMYFNASDRTVDPVAQQLFAVKHESFQQKEQRNDSIKSLPQYQAEEYYVEPENTESTSLDQYPLNWNYYANYGPTYHNPLFYDPFIRFGYYDPFFSPGWSLNFHFGWYSGWRSPWYAGYYGYSPYSPYFWDRSPYAWHAYGHPFGYWNHPWRRPYKNVYVYNNYYNNENKLGRTIYRGRTPMRTTRELNPASTARTRTPARVDNNTRNSYNERGRTRTERQVTNSRNPLKAPEYTRSTREQYRSRTVTPENNRTVTTPNRRTRDSYTAPNRTRSNSNIQRSRSTTPSYQRSTPSRSNNTYTPNTRTRSSSPSFNNSNTRSSSPSYSAPSRSNNSSGSSRPAGTRGSRGRP